MKHYLAAALVMLTAFTVVQAMPLQYGQGHYEPCEQCCGTGWCMFKGDDGQTHFDLHTCHTCEGRRRMWIRSNRDWLNDPRWNNVN